MILSVGRCSILCSTLVIVLAALATSCSTREVHEISPAAQEITESKYTTMSIQGRVVWMAEALERHHGVKPVPDAAERVIALETEDGTLHPIFEDLRGNSFRRDQRLRGIPLELLVRRYDRSPMVQVIQVFSLEKDGKYELDYWCDICAIAMYELKPCECCQGSIELRKRLVQPADGTKN